MSARTNPDAKRFAGAAAAKGRDDAFRLTHDAWLSAKRRYLAEQTVENYAEYQRARLAFLQTWGAQ